MTLQKHPETQPLEAHAAVSGCWSLMPGTAFSLLPREAGVLRIASGRVWATVDGPHTVHGNESGDHFLAAGQVLTVRGGQHLVFESWNSVPGSPVYFDWTPVAVEFAAPATNWQVSVVRPAHDLGHAMVATGQALRQLLWGLTKYGAGLVSLRGPIQRAAAAKLRQFSRAVFSP